MTPSCGATYTTEGLVQSSTRSICLVPLSSSPVSCFPVSPSLFATSRLASFSTTPSNPHQRRLICFLASSASAEASSLDPMWNPSSRIGVEKGASQLEGQPGLRMMARLDPSGEKNRGSSPPLRPQAGRARSGSKPGNYAQ